MRELVDQLFRWTVYAVALCLLCDGRDPLVRMCGGVIAISHLWKDATGAAEWPSWCEAGGMAIAVTLAGRGRTPLVRGLGYLKGAAHIRQLCLGDHRYYY